MHENVSYFPTLTATEPEEISWETVTTTIRGEFLREKTEQYRKALAESNKQLMTSIKRSCPAIICQAKMEGGRSQVNIRKYTGTFMVDFDHVPHEKMTEAVIRTKNDKHTKLCYVTISGAGMRVIASVEGEVTNLNYNDAWRTVNEYYKNLLELEYDPKCISTTRVCGLAYDPNVYFNPITRRIRIRKFSNNKSSSRKGKGGGRPCKAKNVAAKVRKSVEGDGAVYADGTHNDYVSRCVYLMNRYGVDEDDCIEWAEKEFEDYERTHPKSIGQIVKSIYKSKADEHATIHVSNTKKVSISEIETYISDRFIIKRNMLSYQLEYFPKSDSEDFPYHADAKPQRVDDHFVNTLWRHMKKDGLTVETKDINNILGSDFVTDYHPFRSWIESLPAWDEETDYLRTFFSMVHCKDTSDEEFYFYARCWFLAMVASVLDEKVINHEILTFIGQQGTYKSSFMYNILPPLLRDYYATKNNWYMLTKDDYIMLAENIMISLEEIDSMTTQEVNQLKAFTTEPHVKARPPYGRHQILMPRVASLCATGNNITFLSDHSGNRRWLPFLIDHIDNPWEAEIPYEGMYAQAIALIRRGEKFWLDGKQIQELNERNKAFLTPDPAKEMIVTFFTKPIGESETKYMTATKIAGKFAPYLKISPTKVGVAMAELGFEQVRTKHGRFWKVAERPGNEIDSRMPGEKPEPMPF